MTNMKLPSVNQARLISAVNDLSKRLDIPGAEMPPASWNLMTLGRLLQRLETCEAYILQRMKLENAVSNPLASPDAEPPTTGLE